MADQIVHREDHPAKGIYPRGRVVLVRRPSSGRGHLFDLLETRGCCCRPGSAGHQSFCGRRSLTALARHSAATKPRAQSHSRGTALVERVCSPPDCESRGFQLIGQEILGAITITAARSCACVFTAQDRKTLLYACPGRSQTLHSQPYAAAVARRQADQIYKPFADGPRATVILGRGARAFRGGRVKTPALVNRVQA